MHNGREWENVIVFPKVFYKNKTIKKKQHISCQSMNIMSSRIWNWLDSRFGSLPQWAHPEPVLSSARGSIFAIGVTINRRLVK